MGNLHKRSDPERKLRDEELRPFMEGRDWLYQIFHNDKYQTGIPDVFVWHRKHDFRWIDTKIKGRYNFTDDQLILWPIWEKKGLGVWIITEATEEEYRKLWLPPNWREYQRPFERRREIELSKEFLDKQVEMLRNVRPDSSADSFEWP